MTSHLKNDATGANHSNYDLGTNTASVSEVDKVDQIQAFTRPVLNRINGTDHEAKKISGARRLPKNAKLAAALAKAKSKKK